MPAIRLTFITRRDLVLAHIRQLLPDCDAGIVHQHADFLTQSVHRGLDHFLAVLKFGDIPLSSDDLTAVLLHNLCGQSIYLRRGRGGDVVADDVIAASCRQMAVPMPLAPPVTMAYPLYFTIAFCSSAHFFSRQPPFTAPPGISPRVPCMA